MRRDLTVSIITPSYNQGGFIEDAICSVQGQSYPHIEHIIVDGGSTDATLTILRQYRQQDSLRWISEPDQGMYDAINKGLRLAKGDIIAYLNCDDFYLPWSVELAVERLASASIVFGDLIRLDEERAKASPLFSWPFVLDFYRQFGFLSQPTVFLRRHVFERVGLFDQVNFGLIADCDYWLRCVNAGFLPSKIWEFLAIEREHQGMQRATKAKQLSDEIFRLRSRYSRPAKLRYASYRVLNNLFVRIMLVSYAGNFPAPHWYRTKEMGFFKSDFRDFLRELIRPGLPRSGVACDLAALRWMR